MLSFSGIYKVRLKSHKKQGYFYSQGIDCKVLVNHIYIPTYVVEGLKWFKIHLQGQ